MKFFLNGSKSRFPDRNNDDARRGAALIIVFLAFTIAIILRLFTLQVINFDFYDKLASGFHEIYQELLPERGGIWVLDGGRAYPIALNKDYYQIIFDARFISDSNEVAEKISAVLGYGAQEKFQLFLKLDNAKKKRDPYVPIGKKIMEEEKNKLLTLSIKGINFVRFPLRYYPERSFLGDITGFFGSDEKGENKGRYGIEGYFDEILRGKAGFAKGETDAFGAWIPLAKREIQTAKNGGDVFLTIDRTLQFKLCSILKAHAVEFKARSASSVLMDPRTGRIRAMCDYPSFDPNEYNKVEDLNTYNNSSIFAAYEPGSVFKPITMAAAIDQEVIEPETTYVDEGFVKFGKFTIRNAADKIYGKQNMIGVLENSINTGMIFVQEKLGAKTFRKYVKEFGFGEKTSIELVGESTGNIKTLDKDGDIFFATASFGQGISATLLQLASAISAIANGGILMKPTIVDEIRYPDSSVEKILPEELRRVLSERTSALITGMMVSVVENGHGKPAKVKGYKVAGKTGTAQIPGPGGYTEETNQTFVGFAPADDPKYVLAVRYEKPERRFAEYTAAPTFGIFSKFLLQYYKIPPNE